MRTLGAAANRGVRVRAIVGVWGNATHPEALVALERITTGNLRIVLEEGRLFHPKLYLFHSFKDGGVENRYAWIGSANFTKAGFGGHAGANEEIVLEVGPDGRADALANWFQERWDRCSTSPPISDAIHRYTEGWKRSPPSRQIRQIVSGSGSDRKDRLDDANRPLTLEEYRRALSECEEEFKRDIGWEVLDPRGRSYVKVIRARRKLLLEAESWSHLDADSQRQLRGSYRRKDKEWWGLTGRMVRKGWSALHTNEKKVRAILDDILQAQDDAFPEIAVEAMRALMGIDGIGYATATLVLTLARPDRLLSLNSRSANGYGALSRMSHSTLGTPENYGKLLQWLYDQPWYKDDPPKDNGLLRIWNLRAALVDSFVYEP